MSNQKISIYNYAPNLDTICRLCLVPESGSINIFETSKLSIPVRIMACAALEVQSSDGLPKFICDKCRFQLEKSYYFRKKCQQSDGKLRKHIRLLNAGKRSRVFFRSDDDDDDDVDDEEQFEECLSFIRAEEEKLQKEEEGKRVKWLEEHQEQFRKEETQRLFEEFGNFVNSRKPVEKTELFNKEKSALKINPVTSPKAQAGTSCAPKPENPPKRPKVQISPQKQREETNEEEDDHEITSSDQPPEDQEQIWIYDDEEEENTNEGIQTFFLYGKSDEEGNSQIIEIESERLDEMDEDLNREDEPDGVEECQLQTHENEDEGSDDYMLGTEYEVCDNRDEDGSHLDSANIVESYQIEENGDVQYLKEENPTETLSISDDDEVQNILTSTEGSQYHEGGEQKFAMPQIRAKLKHKTSEAPNEQKEEKKFASLPTIAVNYAKISTEDLKIFKCSECPQSFTRENSLMRHRSAHKKGREYSCERCDKWFSCKSSLDRHMRIHTGEKPFTCDQCGKSYMQKEVLKRHLAIHSGERPHPCPHCPRAFVQKLLLTQHINATHLEVPQIQKHGCHLCSKSFHHASGLSRHLITHCGMKFRCSECGRSFNDKSSIRRHVLAVHSKAKDKTIIQATKVHQKNPTQSTTDFII